MMLWLNPARIGPDTLARVSQQAAMEKLTHHDSHEVHDDLRLEDRRTVTDRPILVPLSPKGDTNPVIKLFML
jgi:hypothetical protein